MVFDNLVSGSSFVVRCKLSINCVLNFHSTSNERRTTDEKANDCPAPVSLLKTKIGAKRKRVEGDEKFGAVNRKSFETRSAIFEIDQQQQQTCRTRAKAIPKNR